MARTKRSPEAKGKYFRKPRHLNEESQLRQLLADTQLEEYTVSKLNRVRKRLSNLPDAYDDLHVSCLWDKYC